MANLTLNEYQDKAMSTCLPESDNLFYMLANLVGEVGEFASKAGKRQAAYHHYPARRGRQDPAYTGVERQRRGTTSDAF